MTNIFKFESGDKELEVEIICDDLLSSNLKVDAIVNPSNAFLNLSDVGINGAILKKYGKEVEKKCFEYLSERGTDSINVAEVMHTTIENSDSTKIFIIHACGPIWNENSNKPGNTDFYDDLKRTFFNCLAYAENKLKIESIGIPLIGSGNCGAPVFACYEALYDAIQDFLQDSHNNLKTIKIVNLVPKINSDIIDHFKINNETKLIQTKM